VLWNYDRRVVAVLAFFVLGTTGELHLLLRTIYGMMTKSACSHHSGGRLGPRLKPPASLRTFFRSTWTHARWQQREARRPPCPNFGRTHPRNQCSLHVIDRDPGLVGFDLPDDKSFFFFLTREREQEKPTRVDQPPQ
jgi:hypothetical protein